MTTFPNIAGLLEGEARLCWESLRLGEDELMVEKILDLLETYRLDGAQDYIGSACSAAHRIYRAKASLYGPGAIDGIVRAVAERGGCGEKSY